MSNLAGAKEDAAITFAKNAVRTKYADIPTDALEVTKKQILDSLAVILGGTTAPAAEELMKLSREWGGRGESTILVYGDKVPAPEAALINATLCDALDYDDTHDTGGVHSSTTVIPGCLAVAERKGKVSGREFLTAVALGVDLSTRMGLAYKPGTDLPYDGWDHSALYGGFSTALATGKILGLDEEKMVNALGIAYAQASGNYQCMFEGTLTKRLQIGFASRVGVVSALMAEKGITGARNIFEGQAGLYSVYHRGASHDHKILTADLGKRFEGVGACFKAYPSCRGNHAPIDAALALLHEHGLKPEEVAEVIVFVGNIAHYGNCEPLEVKRNPSNPVVAQFSIPWTVATALVYGKVRIEHFTAEAIKDPSVLQMAQKVTTRLDHSLSIRMAEPVVMEIRTKDGRVLSKRVDFCRGNPNNPIGWNDIKEKLWDCASYSVKPISRENLEKLIEVVPKLEELDDITSVIQLRS